MLFWIKTWRKKTRNVLLFYDGALFRQRWRNPYVNWSYKPTKSITSHVSTFTVTRPAFRCLLCPEWIVNSFLQSFQIIAQLPCQPKTLRLDTLWKQASSFWKSQTSFFQMRMWIQYGGTTDCPCGDCPRSLCSRFCWRTCVWVAGPSVGFCFKFLSRGGQSGCGFTCKSESLVCVRYWNMDMILPMCIDLTGAKK